MLKFLIEILKAVFSKSKVENTNHTPIVDNSKTIVVETPITVPTPVIETKPSPLPPVINVEITPPPKTEEVKPVSKVLITKEQFLKLYPHGKIEIVDQINKFCDAAGINTQDRVAGFVSQCSVESADFTRFIENLNYSTECLLKTFHHYFYDDKDPKDPTTGKFPASQYAHKPEAIANIVYANRYGNGNVASGDGYKFRGRGAIQTTFHDNYAAFAKSLGISIDVAVSLCESAEGWIRSAIYYWEARHCDKDADIENIIALSKDINGGTNGLDERIADFKTVHDLIAVNFK